MISEIALSKGYTSFWEEFFPWLARYSQTINKDLSTRLYAPLSLSDEPQHRSINNIIAFTHYKNLCVDKAFVFKKSVVKAKQVASKFPRNSLSSYRLTPINLKIIMFQVDKLLYYYGEGTIVFPSFPGCGVLSNCIGDIIKGNKLIEVKAGERGIIMSDLKQLIIYCALNWLNKINPYQIEEVELFNPRQGLRWTLNLRIFLNTISDFSLEELFDNMGKYLSDMSNEIVLDIS